MTPGELQRERELGEFMGRLNETLVHVDQTLARLDTNVTRLDDWRQAHQREHDKAAGASRAKRIWLGGLWSAVTVSLGWLSSHFGGK